MKYSEALAFLNSLVNYEKLAKPRNEFKLDDIRNLLGLAGYPQQEVKKIVLVAGTKGKGSVCHMLEAALRACGVRTGMFVSPHVRSVRERIQLLGKPVTKRAFARLVERFQPLVRKQPVSYFELTAALAFEAFARAGVDYAVVEVGLGGRLDATNLSNPDISVITRIGLDHTRVLGSSLRGIAREKAGVMRSGKPVVAGHQLPEVRSELERQARSRETRLVWGHKQTRVWDVRLEMLRDGHGRNPPSRGIAFSVLGELGAGRIRLSLLGRHQVENCAVALTALGLLAGEDTRLRFARVKRGLEGLVIPGRCQVVGWKPLVIVDSCHNPDSGRALGQVIAGHVGRRVVLVYGALKGKLVHKTVKPLKPWMESAILTRPDSPRALPLVALKRVFGRLGVPYVATDSVADALDAAFRISDGSLPVVVAGSFYLAGEVLEHLPRRSSH